MARLGGKFAGILRAEFPAERVPPALQALAELETRGLRVVAEAQSADQSPVATGLRMDLDVVGVDRPGIVREIFQLVAAAGINVEKLATGRRSAPMSGEMLFEARAIMHIPPATDLPTLRAQLDRAARDLMIDVRLEDNGDRTSEASSSGEPR